MNKQARARKAQALINARTSQFIFVHRELREQRDEERGGRPSSWDRAEGRACALSGLKK